MPYVQRDGSGNITGVFVNAQPGFATEFVADSDSSIAAFAPRRPCADGVRHAGEGRAVRCRPADLRTDMVNSQDATTQLIWSSATTFNRNSALIAAAATALGLSSTQVDALFVAAIGINPCN